MKWWEALSRKEETGLYMGQYKHVKIICGQRKDKTEVCSPFSKTSIRMSAWVYLCVYNKWTDKHCFHSVNTVYFSTKSLLFLLNPECLGLSIQTEIQALEHPDSPDSLLLHPPHSISSTQIWSGWYNHELCLLGHGQNTNMW